MCKMFCFLCGVESTVWRWIYEWCKTWKALIQLINNFFPVNSQTHPKSESDDDSRDAGAEENRRKHKNPVQRQISRGLWKGKGKVDTGGMEVKNFEKFTETKNLLKVADDPETLRIKQNTKNISNVAYHGDIQKKAAMERQRELTEIVDNRGKEWRIFKWLLKLVLQLIK